MSFTSAISFPNISSYRTNVTQRTTTSNSNTPITLCNCNNENELYTRPEKNYNADIESGKLELIPEKKGLLNTKKPYYVYHIDKDGEFIYKIKQRYNLPDGALTVDVCSGDKDHYKIYGSVEISEEALKKLEETTRCLRK